MIQTLSIAVKSVLTQLWCNPESVLQRRFHVGARMWASSAGQTPPGHEHTTSMKNSLDRLGLSCVWGARLEETLDEDSPLATCMPATPATQVQPEDHLRALDRKVSQRTPIPAMARARDALATRTDSRVLAVSFHDPTLVRFEHASKRYLAQIGQEVSVR